MRTIPMVNAIVLARLVLCAALGLAAGGPASATDEPWPRPVVRIEDMRRLTPLQMTVPTKFSVDRTRSSTVVLHVHVDAQGAVVRTRIEQSSGNPRIDEAAMHALRTARFEPYRFGGTAEAATLVLPMHVPFAERTR